MTAAIKMVKEKTNADKERSGVCTVTAARKEKKSKVIRHVRSRHVERFTKLGRGHRHSVDKQSPETNWEAVGVTSLTGADLL